MLVFLVVCFPVINFPLADAGPTSATLGPAFFFIFLEVLCLISSLFDIVFLPFSFSPVRMCCCMIFVVAILGLIRRFFNRDFAMVV